jgi:hypothetical protein
MLKKILLALGLMKAPAPVKTYFAVSSFVGVVPALAFVAWKNRDWIKALVQRATPLRGRLASSAPATAASATT